MAWPLAHARKSSGHPELERSLSAWVSPTPALTAEAWAPARFSFAALPARPAWHGRVVTCDWTAPALSACSSSMERATRRTSKPAEFLSARALALAWPGRSGGYRRGWSCAVWAGCKRSESSLPIREPERTMSVRCHAESCNLELAWLFVFFDPAPVRSRAAALLDNHDKQELTLCARHHPRFPGRLQERLPGRKLRRRRAHGQLWAGVISCHPRRKNKRAGNLPDRQESKRTGKQRSDRRRRRWRSAGRVRAPTPRQINRTPSFRRSRTPVRMLGSRPRTSSPVRTPWSRRYAIQACRG